MPRTGSPYPQEFREQLVALHRAGRSLEELAREFEACAATIHSRVRQAERDAGRRAGVPSGAEREELRRLRRENRQLRQERDILSKGRRRSAIGPSDDGDARFARRDATSSRSSSS
jgi:transposase